jgi:tRNA threonylcarbamoyladenosine biosynthesis protein TsaB
VFASGGRTLVAPRAVAIADAVRLARTSAIIVGSGAGLLAEHWPNARSAPRVEQRAAPEIAAIAQLGASADPGLAVPRPLYLRPPDARPQDAARIPRR